MVVRFTVFMGVLLGAVSWILLVPFSPMDFQASPGTNIEDSRRAGLVPEPGNMTLSESIGHEVFEVPDSDAMHLAMVMASDDGMAGMEGMQMGEEGEHAEQPAPDMQMGEQEGEHAEEPAPGMQMTGQEEQHTEEPIPGMLMGAPEGDSVEQPMPGMQMAEPEEEHAEEPMPGMAMEADAGHGAEAEEGGSGFTIMPAGMAAMASRTVELSMAEWGFSNSGLTVKTGETIRFVVRNSGNIPHEFMFMRGAAMAAVSYRQERADWNLLEHEALYERAIVLPGDSFEVVLRIDEPGTWMYMCMFPYHMQFGMMGVMATEGISTDMGGMKM